MEPQGTTAHVAARCQRPVLVLLVAMGTLGWATGASWRLPIVDIWENDGVPVPVGTALAWDYIVRNNSSSQNDVVVGVRLYGLFSSTEPVAGSLPTGWFLGSVTPVTPCTWDVWMLTTDPDYGIDPGEENSFPCVTYRPAWLPEVVVGVRYGQGFFETSWTPLDDFLGPLGIRGDLDHDCDIGADDWPLLAEYIQGPRVTVDCPLGDYDADTDVDLADFAAFQADFPKP